MVDPIQASAADVPGSAEEADRPRRTLNLVLPCKEKRNSDGEATREKVRTTVADLESSGKIASTFAANSAANVPGSAGGGRRTAPPGRRFGLMSVGRMRRSRLYLTIQLCGVTAQQGPPAHQANRGVEVLGFLRGLLGIAHGIAHEIADSHVGEGFPSAQPVRH